MSPILRIKELRLTAKDLPDIVKYILEFDDEFLKEMYQSLPEITVDSLEAQTYEENANIYVK